jgi:peptidoglycan/LPS O-acetylase OafA/YrhL
MRLRGVAAAASLFFLTPLVAEYLLGDIPLSNIGAMIALAPMYGGGAILIREAVRQTGRGWPTFILLALAYAVMEEAFVSQTLFDPHYLGLSLLAYGYIPALGTAFPWLIYVLSIHVIWSMAVPIGLTEALFHDPERKPWLGRIGLGVTVLLLLFGATAAGLFQRHSDPFRDTPGEMICALIAMILLIVAAFRFPRRAPTQSPKTAPAAIVGVACFLLGSALLLIYGRGSSSGWPWPATVLAELIADGLLILLFWWATRMRTWSAVAAWAAASGGMLVYAWYGYLIEHDFGHDYDIVPHSMLVAFFILLAAGAGLKLAKRSGATA